MSVRSFALPLIALVMAAPALSHEDWAESMGPSAEQQAAKPATAPLKPEEAMPLDPRFSPDRVRADVAFFADDLLGGRDTGSVGHEIAARYVAQRFAGLGMVPMGDAGGWLQRVTLQKATRGPDAGSVTITAPDGKATSFTHAKDAVVAISPLASTTELSAPLVFVGYGLENKLLGLDDYAGLDVKGKIVVQFSGFPTGFPSEEIAHASATKADVALAHGALGVITISTNASNKVRPWATTVKYADTPAINWVGADGLPHANTRGSVVNATLSDTAAEALFAAAPRGFAAIRAEADKKGALVRGFALKTRARITGSSQFSRITSPNVVGMIPGSDPALKDQYVVLSGHLDHLGTDAPKPGEAADKDRIYNGALDNAAGTATLLEVARVMAQDSHAPRRSVIFLVTTGEEKGLIGADYFANNPGLAKGKMVGNVDLDMPLLLYPFTDVIAFGADHSSLGKIVANAVKDMNVGLIPDPMPAERIFVRSDHYMFVKQGVPAVFLATGFGNGGAEKWADFLKNTYHKPNDDMTQAINWRAGARFAEANWRITSAMANSDVPPLWYKGDFFGKTFAPKAVMADK
jgi:Zn-dependent M28 family amino/carboxypeptidase